MSIKYERDTSQTNIIYRQQSDIDNILDSVGETIVIDNFITPEEVEHLLDIHQSCKNKRKKLTGPITSEVPYTNKIFIEVFHRIERLLDTKLKIFGGNYFQVNIPHIIHNDVPFDHNTIPGKCIVIPLEKIYKNINQTPKPDDAKFYVFDQMYFHGPVKAFRNSKKRKDTIHNIPLFEYSDVYGMGPENEYPDIDATHCNPEWYRGLTVEKECLWNPGSVIIFDCVRLHCSDDFTFTGIQEKTGLSIFTSYINT